MKKISKLNINPIKVKPKIPLQKLNLSSKEAEPTENEDLQRQLVVARKCRLCKRKCKIRVDGNCDDAAVFCKDFKQASLKMSIPKQEI